MAAHNLRESLRDVASFSQLMAETYAGRLDSDAGVFLERIQEGAARMQSLLADVVDYWATGTGDRQSSRTDMEAVLRQALLSTDKQIAERSAIVTHDPLPAVIGDFEILTKVLHHLIQKCHRILRHAFSARSHFIQTGRSRMGVFGARQWSWHRPGIPRAAYSECLSACTGKNTPGTDLDSHSARRPSSGMAVACGWNRHPGRDRHSTSLFLRLISTCRRRAELAPSDYFLCSCAPGGGTRLERFFVLALASIADNLR